MNDHIGLSSNVRTGLSVPPQSVNGTVNGTGINFDQGGAEVMAEFAIGTVGSGATGTLKLQSSLNDNTGTTREAADAYTDISGASTTISGSDANTLIKLTTNARAESFVRAVVITTGATLVSAVLHSPTRKVA